MRGFAESLCPPLASRKGCWICTQGAVIPIFSRSVQSCSPSSLNSAVVLKEPAEGSGRSGDKEAEIEEERRWESKGRSGDHSFTLSLSSVYPCVLGVSDFFSKVLGNHTADSLLKTGAGWLELPVHLLKTSLGHPCCPWTVRGSGLLHSAHSL